MKIGIAVASCDEQTVTIEWMLGCGGSVFPLVAAGFAEPFVDGVGGFEERVWGAAAGAVGGLEVASLLG